MTSTPCGNDQVIWNDSKDESNTKYTSESNDESEEWIKEDKLGNWTSKYIILLSHLKYLLVTKKTQGSPVIMLGVKMVA